MRPLDELVNVPDPAWPEIEQAVRAAPYPVHVLPTAPQPAAACLHRLQVTTASWLGAVVFHTGGIRIDDGWLRVFGAGDPHRGLVDIHSANQGDQPGLVIAQDVLGGQFSWGQATPDAPPTVHYFGPDELSWLDLESGYSDWLNSMLAGATEEFYADLHWSGWRSEVRACPLDQGINAYPPPWSEEGRDLGAASRRPVPMAELTAHLHDTARQFT